MKVLILGAGVAGVASAWYFWRDGHEVTVLERNTGVALETSFANGGQLSYSYVAPLASPSVIPKIPPWLLRRDSPLRFRPALDPRQWRWCLEFLAACNTKTADLTTQRLLRLSFYSRDLMHDLVQWMADRGAEAEGRPPLTVPRLANDLALPDQLQVVAADLHRFAPAPVQQGAADRVNAVRGAFG